MRSQVGVRMSAIPPDQITMECMDCGRQSIGPRPATAPAGAVLYVIRRGCEVPSTRGEPFYVDGEGELIEQHTGGRGPRHHK
jgi:hypothetical protein